MGKTRAEWYAFLDEIVEGCLFELDQDTAEAMMVDGWKYDLAGSSLELISDHAFRAKRHVQVRVLTLCFCLCQCHGCFSA